MYVSCWLCKINSLSSSIYEYNSRNFHWANIFWIPEHKNVEKQKHWAISNRSHMCAWKPKSINKCMTITVVEICKRVVFVYGAIALFQNKFELVSEWTRSARPVMKWLCGIWAFLKQELTVLWFQLHGTMRVVMKPLVNKLPIIGGYTFFFLNQPVGVITGWYQRLSSQRHKLIVYKFSKSVLLVSSSFVQILTMLCLRHIDHTFLKYFLRKSSAPRHMTTKVARPKNYFV